MYATQVIHTGVSGFVLAGGGSRRMGTNKALLDHGGEPLIQTVFRQVFHAVGNAAILGDPEVYGDLRVLVVEDIHKGYGPIGGLHAALSTMPSQWCLLVACDMPGLDPGFLGKLVAEISDDHRRCIAALDEDGGFQPLCAVYHRSCLGEVELAIAEGRLRMRDLVERLGAHGIADPAGREILRNVNTPEQWHQYLADKNLRDSALRSGLGRGRSRPGS